MKSALPSRQHISRMANPRIFCSYEFSPPQLLQNLQLRKPLASADSKATLTPLDSALTDDLTLTPAESTLTKRGGGSSTGPTSTHPTRTGHRARVLSSKERPSPELTTGDWGLTTENSP